MQGRLLLETTERGNLIRAYVWLDNLPLVQIDIKGHHDDKGKDKRRNRTKETIAYLHTDHLGTPRIATDVNQQIVWRWDSDAFGAKKPDDLDDEHGDNDRHEITVNLRNDGQYFDSETGLHYWGARYYDPKTGRGLSPDRMGVAWHVQRYRANLGVPNQPPLEINPYVAFANNPLRWSDPTGLWSITAGGYIGVGGEITFGSDAGNGFLTGRFGFGLGGGVSYDPNGGIPGPAPQDRSTGGAVLSCSAQANFNAGPLTGSLEGGAARNYSNDQSSIYGGPSANFSPDVFHGLSITGSAGGQFTFYTGRTGR